MTYEQIINLLDRGFTPDQISGLSADVPPAVTPPVNPSPGIDPAGDPPVTPSEGSPAPDPGPAEPAEPVPTEEDIIRDMQQEIANLKSQMQRTNIITRSVERIPVSANQVDSVLAEFIRPPVNIDKNNGGK